MSQINEQLDAKHIADQLVGLLDTPASKSNLAVDSYGPKLTNTIVRHSYWYDSIIDWLLANPGRTQRECAKYFNKSEPTMRMLLQSDMFKSRFETRRREMSEQISKEIVEETSTLALSALREVNKRIRDNPAAIPTGQVAEIANSALDRLGYGQKTMPSVVNSSPVVVNVTVPATVLNEARQSMRELHSKNMLSTSNGPIVDITPKDSSND